MEIEILETPGMGNATYIVASEGQAAVVDPQRDAWRFTETAERRGWRITHIIETHVHNDYVSGALQAQAATGAAIVAPARGGYEFGHVPAEEGHVVEIGELRLVAMATPGHTPEHLAWLVTRGAAGSPAAVLTGGSLLVGSAGRTDLLGPGRMTGLSIDQYTSLRRLADLPSEVSVLPTHGAGSFCVVGTSDAERTSTIGRERLANPFLSFADPDDLRRSMVTRLGRFPTYYANVARLNRIGPATRDTIIAPPARTPDEVARLVDEGAVVVDARDRWTFGDAHIPGAVNVEPTASFGTWVAAVVPFGAPLVLVTESGSTSQLRDLAVQLWRVGFERLFGFLDGGVDAWEASGRSLVGHDLMTSDELAAELVAGLDPSIVDVRQPTEWRDGTLARSRTIFAGDLRGRIGLLPRDRTWTVVCRSGMRAAIAASLLSRAGHQVRVVVEGGVPDVLSRLEEGSRRSLAMASRS